LSIFCPVIAIIINAGFPVKNSFLSADLTPYQFEFIDSVSKAGMEELRKQYPGVSFIFIYHTTKEGNIS
jgi:hypothetical protein